MGNCEGAILLEKWDAIGMLLGCYWDAVGMLLGCYCDACGMGIIGGSPGITRQAFPAVMLRLGVCSSVQLSQS